MWSGTEREEESFSGSGAFRNEIAALGSIRHRNIVRLLGWGANRATKLLFYNYLPNGSLSGYLHRGGGGGGGGGKQQQQQQQQGGEGEWERRYEMAVGVAHAVAYLHHDCVPAILHGDVKPMNVLLGPDFEPYLADFGLARLLGAANSNSNSDSNLDLQPPNFAPPFGGSYGYIAPEYASMQRITAKSDVYSYGVVLLEILTGRHPLDPTLPGGTHLVQWVRDHLQRKLDPIDLLDPRLRGRPDSQIQEMLQALAISVLCICPRADDRPTMKDVAALLREIRRPAVDEPQKEPTGAPAPAAAFPAPSTPFKGSSNCSFAMSDYSS
ncbi:putative LRR receptor-like serine/threonine-protein kinase [Ananas comosus]|uniref:Putative LRR receptor-like serine/threonine-protein kinase n=1 Tax=Ananas comosus TaxID=4615 RepID=A0A199UZM3_ANACO|nr:putative LRR receptor-like serine/threonine-protein kinase [Ananas comosus]